MRGDGLATHPGKTMTDGTLPGYVLPHVSAPVRVGGPDGGDPTSGRDGDPFLIQGPALVSFSGGRTSGYMLWRILQAHGGRLPEGVHVAFANTGREMDETLDFVADCSRHWDVPITWLEYDPEAEHRTRVVGHNSASRDGEPFTAVIRASRSGMLPNPVTRFCTIEMKIRRFYMLMHRMRGYERWTSVVGLRADEATRVANQTRRNALGKDRFVTAMPLSVAGVTKRDVKAFWDAQPFDLRLLNVNGRTPDGNCDCCFLKSENAIMSVMRRRPERAAWWIATEREAMDREVSTKVRNESVRRFRKDRWSYEALFDASRRQGDLLEVLDGDASVDCACTD